MLKELIALIDCREIVDRPPILKLHPLFSSLMNEKKICACFLVSTKDSAETAHQLSKSLKKLINSDHVIKEEFIPKLLFLAKTYVDDKYCNDIILLSPSYFLPRWKALSSVLFAASSYKISFESFDREQIDETPIDLNSVEDEYRNLLMNINTEEPVQILRSNIIPEDIFYHGFSTRLGGVSGMKTLKSLNLHYTSAKKDPKIVINENVRRFAKAGGFKPETLQVVKIQHGSEVWEMGTSQPEAYDAIITSESNITIAAPGADCLIILFADPVRKMCAVAHSGWKGTLLKVAKEVVQKMVQRGSNPKDIRVVIGPGIEGCCLSIPAEYLSEFENIDSSLKVPLKDSKDDGLDLFKANRLILEKNGILPENIDTESQSFCTVCKEELFYSHRRDSIPFGSQMGYIGLRK